MIIFILNGNSRDMESPAVIIESEPLCLMDAIERAGTLSNHALQIETKLADVRVRFPKQKKLDLFDDSSLTRKFYEKIIDPHRQRMDQFKDNLAISKLGEEKTLKETLTRPEGPLDSIDCLQNTMKIKKTISHIYLEILP